MSLVYNEAGVSMKRILLVLLIFFLVAAAGAVFFLAAFDADCLRPTVIKKMEEALGRPVNLERIALRWPREIGETAISRGWRGGIAVELRGLEIPPSFRFDSVRVLLPPLLKRQVVGRTENIRLPNVNLLREAFDRMTVIPGLTESLLDRLPPEFAQKLTEKDTLFRPMDFHLTLENGAVLFRNFRVATDSFELVASGRAGLDGSLAFPAQIFIQQDLSKALIQSVDELRFFTDDQWRIVLPVRVGGTVQKPSVSPDLQFVAEKLFSAKAQDLVGELLNKAFKK